jgi:hypothetical protein
MKRPETEAERIERLDREAIRTYRARRYSGGEASRRYRLDMDEASRPTTAPHEQKPKTDEPTA